MAGLHAALADLVPWIGPPSICFLAISCTAPTFSCENDDACRKGGQGWCEADGACSFPDPGCESGRRYGSLGSAHLAGMCVPGANSSTHAEAADGPEEGGNAPESGVLDDAMHASAADTTSGFASDSWAETVTQDSTAVSAGSATSTAGTTTSTSDPTEGTTGPMDSTGDGGDPYGSCQMDACVGVSECQPDGALPITCAPPCQNAADCPAPLSGSAVPACIDVDGEGWCALSCANEPACPEGMKCTGWEAQNYGLLCTWY